MSRLTRLGLLRHAAAEYDSPSGRDFDRPLSPGGCLQAGQVGQDFVHDHAGFDLALCSPSLRTRETATLVLERLASPPEVRLVEDIYEATVSGLLGVLEAHPVARVLLVGHNPGISGLASYLCGPGHSLSPGDLRIIDFEPPAAHPLQPGSGHLLSQ
ncbi:MAG: histidine phosphatase family protein [Xanthomonadales bacterium]|nr:histidine phosphatase family protein [Xanthomonadales bacterium]